MAATLRVVLGVDNASKLTLPCGIPTSVETLKEDIKKHFGLSEDFRLQYRDVEFDNEYMNLTTTTDIKDKSTVKVIYTGNYAPTEEPTAAYTVTPPVLDSSSSLPDTDILSSPGSSASSLSLRLQQWPSKFPIPQFCFDVQFQLDRAQQDYVRNGTVLDPGLKLKSDILEMLASEIAKYKVYPSGADIDQVAEALVREYPCLQETGSVTGHQGWKISLAHKMANYRTTLRNIGCPEVAINSVQHKREREENPCRNAVKKPHRAEVNFFPQYPTGETKESQEEERKELLVEVKKRDNEQIIKTKMEKTFAHRRREVIEDKPFIAEFKNRWPALFAVLEIDAEFARITTVPLLPTFMSSLDRYSVQLMRILRRKGGEAADRINTVMSPIGQTSLIEVKRESILKALMIYLREKPEDLIKEYIDVNVMEVADLDQVHIGIYKIIREGAQPDDSLEDVGIIIEQCIVLQDLKDVATACVLLFGLIYCLNLSYPKTLRYTFEFFQKVLMGLEDKKLSNKIQVLKNKLCQNA